MTSQNPPSETIAASGDKGASPSARRIVLALVILCAGLVACDLAFGTIMDRVYEKSAVNPAARVVHAAPEVVIVGASGGKYALDPAILGGKTYNAAENGQSGFYVAALLNALPAHSVTSVIYAFDPSEVHTGLASGNLKHLAKFAPWVSEDPKLKNWLAAGSTLEGWKYVSGFYRYRGIVGATLRRRWRPKWERYAFKGLDRIMPPAEAIVTGEPEKVFAPSPGGREMLQAIKNAVQRHNAQLIVVTTPAYGYDRNRFEAYAPLYREMRRAFADLEICDLTMRHDPRMDDVLLTPEYYADSAHLNAAGAQAYSKLVVSWLKARCDWKP